MNFIQLVYLKELSQQGSFSLAAQKLGITQPALSLQIQKLEEEIGFKLIDRGKRPLALTSEGEIFFQKSLEILKMTEQLKSLSIEMADEIKGCLKVGIIPTLAPYLVPFFIGELRTTYPGLQVEIIEMKTEEIILSLKTGNLDCGILSTPVVTAGVIFELLFYERFYAYVSERSRYYSRSKLNIRKLNDEDIWYLEEGNCFQNQVNSICRVKRKTPEEYNLVYKSNSIESLRRIVENQNGLTFIPELATINIPPDHEDMIKEIEGEQPVREISIALIRNVARERHINALKNAILRNIPKRMTEKPDGWVVDTELKIK
jgi:LysR family hydrogen peroxide-inducible transcriptional activator